MRKSHLTKNGRFLLSLAFVSSVFFGIAGYSLINGEIEYGEKMSKTSLKPTSITDNRQEMVNNTDVYYANVTFHTNDVFSVNNNINYTIDVFVNNTKDFDKMLATVTNTNTDLLLTNGDPDNLTNHHFSFNNVTLNRIGNTNKFENNILNFAPKSQGGLGFVILLFDHTELIHMIPILHDHPLIIESSTAELQAQTDRDIQQQNIESARTNAHIEGLTFVIIGLVPLGLVGEYFIEKFVEERERKPRNSYASIHSK